MAYKLDPVTGKYTYVPESDNNSPQTSPSNVIKNQPSNSDDELKGVSDNKTEANSSNVFGRGVCKGDYGVRKYSALNMVGLSNKFNGTYYASEVTHTISSQGYLVDFSIKTKLSDIGKTATNSQGTDTKGNSGSNNSSGTNGGIGTSPNTGGQYKLDPNTGKYTKI